MRSLLPHIVIMNMFCMFAILVIYLLYLNPDQYIDDVTRLFNGKGWTTVLNEAPLHRDFGMAGFGICNYAELRETRGIAKVDASLRQIGSWIRENWPSLPSFYLGNGVFILCDIRPFDEESVLNSVTRRFALPWTSDNGEYYLRINQVFMKPVSSIISRDILNGAVWETYHLLVQGDETEPINIDEIYIRSHLRRNEVQSILNDALTAGSLSMFLQPIVSTSNDRVEGAEALCRLPDGKGGYIFPDEFIPLAMTTGSMGLLGSQMFEKACAFMSREDVRFGSLKWINVNVAPEQFRNPNLLSEFLQILDKYSLEPSRIHLEITEETMIDRKLLHDSMVEFRKKGFIFSMDDFGSSYSNMIRLQQNNFSNVKIDRDFTWSYFKKKTALLPDIIHTCHDLGMKVVTEGVETKEMVDGIKEIGADYIQGYYYSKPVPWEDFLKKYVQKGN